MSALRQFSAYGQIALPAPARVPHRTILTEKQSGTPSTATVLHIGVVVPWRDLSRGKPLDDILRSIEIKYVIEARYEVAEFIQKNHLRGLLLEAVRPLNTFFGTDAIKALTLVTDDEGSESLFCLLVTPGEMEDARNRLRSFDEDWWLVNSARSGGKLNFDFELI
jgi:hypothetical protein